ncbi:Hepatocyte growth factor-regulated tyrosine kinase substrate [Eumeta japonica]|uniref:Hepatocyte growth factor-regulated tyrosine kinase substrate n=1 Tax=Eumeta variegata TaxID=151549 RepID=A0A4C1X844_EUMVA|nr:Hepatocyte growth factor-regulated tyrosine kinase substrate [Eumeta japonica]
MFRSSNFDKLLDKATSNLRLDPDWPTIIQICDLIRQNDCSPKYAVAAVKKKLASQNPHQAMFALLVLESIVKNCGSGVHDEVATKAFCEMLRELVKSSPHENLRNKILELIQAWAFAFRNTPKYRAVQDMVNILKAEGHKFPSLKESDAMFSADTAPEWADGEVCHRCRVAFSLMLRRHHCRACGQVFCQQCSSKTSTIPKYGIEKEVRVCDACYEKMNRPQTAATKLEIVDTSNDYGPAQQQQRRLNWTPGEKMNIKSEPLTPEEFFENIHCFDQPLDDNVFGALKKSLSMSDITALKDDLKNLNLNQSNEEAVLQRYRKRSHLLPNDLTKTKKREIELEEIKKYRIKANPIPKSVFEGSKNLPDIPKKPATVPEPFKLTQVLKKPINESSVIHKFKARPVPKQILQKTQLQFKLTSQVAKKMELNAKHSKSADDIKDADINGKQFSHTRKPKIVQPVQREGPLKPEPFSFEKRDEELKRKHEEKINKVKKEEKKLANNFRAKPISGTVKARMQKVVGCSSKSNSSVASVENKENKFEARIPVVLYKPPFKPVLKSNQATNPDPFDLNTEKRAIEREQFDKQLKEREEEKESLRQQLELERQEMEKKMNAKLRAQLKRTGKSAEELQEEEELQLALALSQSEAEHKEKERKTRPYIVPEPAPQQPSVSPTPSSVSASPEHSSGNTELSRYLDRSYWEQRLARDASSAPTAPVSHTPAPSDDFTAKSASSKLPDEEAEDRELDEFVGNLKTQVEIFVNRMKSNSSRGRSIANDSSVQTLFMNITAMHSRLLRFIQQQDDKRVYLESLQDKVTQVRDSRAALDTLRAEHAARLAAAAEAAERQRQMQMAAKLQAMRKKKHEYLQYQRQLALQRVQEQEREMQMRQEQQKHQYMMSSAGFYMPSSVAMHQFQPGYPNQAIYANPQYQAQMLPQATTDTSVPMLNQSQITQANMPLNVNQVGPGPQPMPQISQPYPISTAGMVVSQAGATSQAPMNSSNLRTSLGQQLPMQSQLIMQHPIQMRIPIQHGVNPMISQNMTNGLTSQNLSQPQTQQTSQIPKQGLPTQGTLMNQLPMGQQSFGQSNTSNNPILSMQMQNMRMPLTQGNQINTGAQSMAGFTMSHLPNQTNQQPGHPIHSMQQQQQISLSGQLSSHSGQQMMQGQSLQNQGAQVMPTNHNLPNPGNQVPSQNQPIQSQVQQVHSQVSQPAPLHGQHMPQPQTIPGQTVPLQVSQQLSHSQAVQGQAMSMQGQQTPHSQGQPMSIQSQLPQIVQGQSMPPQNLQGQPLQTQQHIHLQGQQMQNQGQGSLQAPQMMNQNQPIPNVGQQVSIQGQPIPLQQQIPQNQMPAHNMQIPPQGNQMPTQDSNVQQNIQNNSQGTPGQPMKIQPQNFALQYSHRFQISKLSKYQLKLNIIIIQQN